MVNEMVYIAICDDDENMVEYVNKVVYEYFFKNKMLVKIIPYTNSENLAFDVQEGHYFDMIILDIQMPKLSGMQLAKSIRNHIPNCLIIFLTSYLKYAIDAFDLSAFRYIPKNEISKRLESALNDASEMIFSKESQYYIINTPKVLKKIFYNDILYITKDGKNSIIFTLQNERIRVRKSLSRLYKELNCEELVFIDRGCISNISNIMKIEDNSLYMRNGEKIDVSKAHLTTVKLKIALFWDKKI